MMHIKIVSIAIAVSCLLVANVQAQLAFDGECSNYPVKVVQKFDGAKYLGIWYEIKRYETFFQLDADCVTANYSSLPNNEIKVVNRAELLETGEITSVEGVAHFVDPSKEEGKLIVEFPLSIYEGNYWVLGTDYETFSVVWSCSDIMLNLNIQFLWVLSRTPTLSSEKLAEVEKILSDAKLDSSKLRETIQDASVCHW